MGWPVCNIGNRSHLLPLFIFLLCTTHLFSQLLHWICNHDFLSCLLGLIEARKQLLETLKFQNAQNLQRRVHEHRLLNDQQPNIELYGGQSLFLPLAKNYFLRVFSRYRISKHAKDLIDDPRLAPRTESVK